MSKARQDEWTGCSRNESEYKKGVGKRVIPLIPDPYFHLHGLRSLSCQKRGKNRVAILKEELESRFSVQSFAVLRLSRISCQNERGNFFTEAFLKQHGRELDIYGKLPIKS